jgi:hypothetical protein
VARADGRHRVHAACASARGGLYCATRQEPVADHEAGELDYAKAWRLLARVFD